MENAPAHPSLLILGMLAMAPLLWLALGDLRRLRRLRGEPAVEGILEQTDKGVFTLRSGDRRVTVYTEQGEILSVGLGGPPASATTWPSRACGPPSRARSSAPATPPSRRREPAPGPGAILVVGDHLSEARRRLLLDVGLNAGLAVSGVCCCRPSSRSGHGLVAPTWPAARAPLPSPALSPTLAPPALRRRT